MKTIRWDAAKNDWLWANRGVDFRMALDKIASGDWLDVVENPRARFAHQMMFILDIGKYAYLVPFVETETEIFLKTMYPN